MGNTFSGDGTNIARINDEGTGTIFAGQATAENGQNIRFSQPASSQAVTIQNATGLSYFTANTSSNVIQIGSSTTDGSAVLFGLDSYNQATDPTGFDGAMYYNSSLGKFRCYQNGTWNDCVATAQNFIQNQNATDQTANFRINGSGQVATLSAATSISTPLIRPITDSTTALHIQSATGNTLMNFDTTNSRVYIGSVGGDSAGRVLVVGNKTTAGDPSGVAGAMYYDTTINKFRCYTTVWADCNAGGATGAQLVVLSPEFAGGLLSADGSDNNGYMTSDYDATSDRNYYNWTSGQGTLQDYSIYVRTRVPSNYISNFGSFTVWMYGTSNSTANNDVQVELKVNGTTCSALASYLPGTATVWTGQTISTSGCTSIAANDTITIQIKVFAKSNNAVRIGDIQYSYTN